MPGLRYRDDPLATVSERFPLSSSGFNAREQSETASGPQTRPYALRWLVDMGMPTEPGFYRYCPVRQIAVHCRTGRPRPPQTKLEWTTIANKDGDEGPSKDYGWETVPDG